MVHFSRLEFGPATAGSSFYFPIQVQAALYAGEWNRAKTQLMVLGSLAVISQ